MWRSLYFLSKAVGLVTFSLDPAKNFAPVRSRLDLVHAGVVGGALVTTTATLLVHAVTARGRGFSASALPLCLGAVAAILLNATRNLPVFRELAANVPRILGSVPPSRSSAGGVFLAASYVALRGWHVGRLVVDGDVDVKTAIAYAYVVLVDLVLHLQFDAFQLFQVTVTRHLRTQVQQLLAGNKYLDSSSPRVRHIKARAADQRQLRGLQRLYGASHRAGVFAVDAVKVPLLLSVVHHFFDALWHLYLALSSSWLLHCSCVLSHLSLLLVLCVLGHVVVAEARGVAASGSRLLLLREYANSRVLEDEVVVFLKQLVCCRHDVTSCGMVKIDTKLFGGVVVALSTYLLLLYTYAI